MVRSPPVRVKRQPSSPAVIPSGAVEARLETNGRVRSVSSQYSSAAPKKPRM